MIFLIELLNKNKIKYEVGDYAGHKSIIIKRNKYKMEIYYNKGFVSDLQKIPYTWGKMGSTTLSNIINDLKEYLLIKELK